MGRKSANHRLFGKSWESYVNKLIKRFGKDESGATAIEYALIAAIVGIGIITALGSMKDELNETFEKVESSLSEANAE